MSLKSVREGGSEKRQIRRRECRCKENDEAEITRRKEVRHEISTIQVKSESGLISQVRRLAFEKKYEGIWRVTDKHHKTYSAP